MREKQPRNDEIRALWRTGVYAQSELAARFSLTQSRISAIIHRRRPSIRYCRYYGARMPGSSTTNICPDDVGKAAARRRLLTLLRRIARKKQRLEIALVNADARAIVKNVRSVWRKELRDSGYGDVCEEALARI